ncbi:YqaE/Pmp3 family membrane protein [Pontibacter sp. Tf4]|uniref:YqaE/Pmp3 family membrane protein n=1 Tax=Pontibacter sp. Tf4 TaxID=2761620 RepID=UPI0021049252|nr:YqaE/Pmp3 family membrane protein [Pontibacter sp. Tf4]
MKFKNLLQLVFVLIAGQLLFACSSAKYYEFAAHKQAPYQIQKKQTPAAEAKETQDLTVVAMVEAEETKSTETAPAPQPVLEASVAAKPAAGPVKITPVAPATEKVVTEAEAVELVKERMANMTKAEKKELKKELKEAIRQGGSRTSIVEIILAVLLPPLAVFLHDGIGTSFWISIILTLLFWLPGVIYALLVVTDTI